MTTTKTDQDQLIGVELVVEIEFLPILGMMKYSTILDVAILRLMANINRHMLRKDNSV